MRKTSKYLTHFSIFLILGTYGVSPIQVSAQDAIAQEVISEQVLEETQQIANETYPEYEELDKSSDLEEKSKSDLAPEMSNDGDEGVLFPEELIDDSADASEIEDDEETDSLDVYNTEGYSHIESSPGIVVVTTPSDATIETLVDYLDIYFQSTDIKKLTIYGMINTGVNEKYSQTFGLSKYTGLTYLEIVDLEVVGDGALLFLSNLIEIYLPKVTTIGHLAFWNNSFMLKLDAPLVEVVGTNAFYGVTNLEVLIAPSWHNIEIGSGFLEGWGPTASLKEISTGYFSVGFPLNIFPNLNKQTLHGFFSTELVPQQYIIFENVTELVVSGLTTITSSTVAGDFSNVKSISSDTLTGVNLSGFTSLENIDFDEELVLLWENSFSGTKIETLRLSSLRNNVDANAFVGAEHLKEIYLPNINAANAAGLVNLPGNVDIVGTTSTRLIDFQNALDANPHVLFAATESNESLPFDDKQIKVGGAETLTSDFSSYILNEDVSQTAFELNQNWFFENELIGNSETYAIRNMNQSNVGTYHYSVNIIPTEEGSYYGSRESRKAQIGIVNEISFTSDFSVNSVVGELQNLEILFSSNVTSVSSSFKIVVPESLKVDDANIELYLDNVSSSIPMGATVAIEDRVVTITNVPLISGFNYHINIPIMPIAVSEENEEIKIDFLGNFDPVGLSGEVMITPGEFNVSIPDQINFEETFLDFSSVQSTIQKVNPLDIEITSFTAQEESWEIMVSATPFMNTENQEVGEEAIRLVYKENGDMYSLSEEISLATGSFSGKLDYDFQTDAWSNTSHALTELEEEGFHVLVGNDYYKLESQQTYKTEVNFTIQYSP
ncbi:leucine-rich repeat protein [Enterococcus sp. AZ012]|uniref:leucine-rich repeat protein n=1 Tax=unclassified Enterococcus TaxID=2608891 RepID=UPI003D2A91B2